MSGPAAGYLIQGAALEYEFVYKNGRCLQVRARYRIMLTRTLHEQDGWIELSTNTPGWRRLLIGSCIRAGVPIKEIYL